MGQKPESDQPVSPHTPSEDGIPAPSGAANLIDTDYVIGQDNIKGEFSFSLDIHGKVFIISAATIVLFVILTLALQNEVEPLFNAIRNWITGHLAWLFMSIANIFVVLCFVLILSPLGKVRLGGK